MLGPYTIPPTKCRDAVQHEPVNTSYLTVSHSCSVRGVKKYNCFTRFHCMRFRIICTHVFLILMRLDEPLPYHTAFWRISHELWGSRASPNAPKSTRAVWTSLLTFPAWDYCSASVSEDTLEDINFCSFQLAPTSTTGEAPLQGWRILIQKKIFQGSRPHSVHLGWFTPSHPTERCKNFHFHILNIYFCFCSYCKNSTHYWQTL